MSELLIGWLPERGVAGHAGSAANNGGIGADGRSSKTNEVYWWVALKSMVEAWDKWLLHIVNTITPGPPAPGPPPPTAQ